VEYRLQHLKVDGLNSKIVIQEWKVQRSSEKIAVSVNPSRHRAQIATCN